MRQAAKPGARLTRQLLAVSRRPSPMPEPVGPRPAGRRPVRRLAARRRPPASRLRRRRLAGAGRAEPRGQVLRRQARGRHDLHRGEEPSRSRPRRPRTKARRRRRAVGDGQRLRPPTRGRRPRRRPALRRLGHRQGLGAGSGPGAGLRRPVRRPRPHGRRGRVVAPGRGRQGGGAGGREAGPPRPGGHRHGRRSRLRPMAASQAPGLSPLRDHGSTSATLAESRRRAPPPSQSPMRSLGEPAPSKSRTDRVAWPVRDRDAPVPGLESPSHPGDIPGRTYRP